jgi:hypothetical protein
MTVTSGMRVRFGSLKAPSPTASTHLILPHRAVAVVASLFGVTCLSVLVVVSAIDDESALSTVALALAILAFSIQIIVFVAQQNLAAEQGRRSEELYGKTQSLLAEIKEKTAGTQVDVRRISDRTERMVEGVLSKGLADAYGGKVDVRRLAEDVTRTVDQSDAESGEDGEVEPIPWPPRHPQPDDGEVITQLKTYPAPEEVGDSLATLQHLSRKGRIRLKAFGDDEIKGRQPDSPLDPALLETKSSELEEAGLIEPLPGQTQPATGTLWLMRLSKDGRQVARLLTARSDPPEYLEGLEKIRKDTPDLYPEWQGED